VFLLCKLVFSRLEPASSHYLLCKVHIIYNQTAISISELWKTLTKLQTTWTTHITCTWKWKRSWKRIVSLRTLCSNELFSKLFRTQSCRQVTKLRYLVEYVFQKLSYSRSAMQDSAAQNSSRKKYSSDVSFNSLTKIYSQFAYPAINRMIEYMHLRWEGWQQSPFAHDHQRLPYWGCMNWSFRR